MTKTSPTEENPSPLAKSHEEEEEDKGSPMVEKFVSCKPSPLATAFQLKDTKSRPHFINQFRTNKKKSTSNSGGIEEEESEEKLSGSKRPQSSKPCSKLWILPTLLAGASLESTKKLQGELFESEFEFSLLNEQRKATENDIVGLEQDIEMNSVITVIGMEALKALIEKKVIKTEKSDQFVKINSIKRLNVCLPSFMIVWEGEASASSCTTGVPIFLF